MIKPYELEDYIRFFIKNDITEFYAEEISNSFNKLLSETFNALFKFSETDNHKIKMFYETKCPDCKDRIKEHTDLLSVEIGEACKCESCGEFIKGKENTYIFFRATDEWVNFLKKIEEKEAIKAKEKELARIKNEADIIKQLNRILDTFENIPEGGLSIEGKIIRSQINTYLNSKKEAI